MKSALITTLAIGAACVALGSHARAAQEGGTICGRVNAPSNYIFQLRQSPQRQNIAVARSQNDEVTTHVNVDGTFCFSGLSPQLYTVIAFPGSSEQFSTLVTPVAGKTIQLNLAAQPDEAPSTF